MAGLKSETADDELDADLLTAIEAAMRVGTTASTIRGWCHQGLLAPAGQRGKALLFDDLTVALCERARRQRGPGRLNGSRSARRPERPAMVDRPLDVPQRWSRPVMTPEAIMARVRAAEMAEGLDLTSTTR